MGRKTELLVEELYEKYNEYIESVEDDSIEFEQWLNEHLCDECLDEVLMDIEQKLEATKKVAVMVGM
jgi:hypothetical protein